MSKTQSLLPSSKHLSCIAIITFDKQLAKLLISRSHLKYHLEPPRIKASDQINKNEGKAIIYKNVTFSTDTSLHDD